MLSGDGTNTAGGHGRGRGSRKGCTEQVIEGQEARVEEEREGMHAEKTCVCCGTRTKKMQQEKGAAVSLVVRLFFSLITAVLLYIS